MIRSSFQILDRIGSKKEMNLWKQGITDWNKFIEKDTVHGIGKKKFLDRQLIKAKQALYSYDSAYFVDKLPTTETWRLYEHFKEDCVFLDIEADSVQGYGDVTVIGLFDGLNTKTMINGINMDLNVLKEELSKYKLIITFNGSSFDLPFISKRYDILPKIPHIDLRHLCAKLDLNGGLKEIETEFGIKRNKIIEKFSGGDPLTLYKMYKATGERYYLDLLVEYNEDDVISLKKIMNNCYDELAKKTLKVINYETNN